MVRSEENDPEGFGLIRNYGVLLHTWNYYVKQAMASEEQFWD